MVRRIRSEAGLTPPTRRHAFHHSNTTESERLNLDTILTTSDLFSEMRRRKLWLVRLYVYDREIDAAEFHYDDGPAEVVHLEHHNCNCEFCLQENDGTLADLSRRNDPMLAYMDDIAAQIDGSSEVMINANSETISRQQPGGSPSVTRESRRFLQRD